MRRLRPWLAVQIDLATPPDSAALLAIYAPFVEGTTVSFETEVPSLQVMRQRVADALGHAPWLVARIDGRVAGYAYAVPHRSRASYQWSVDVSVYVDPAFQRQGVGRRLYLRLFELMRAQGYFNAYAGIVLPNNGSVGMHEAVGFRPVGVYQHVGFKLGRWHDVGWWQLALRPADGPPGPLRPVAEVWRP
jgi:L-amino acid N-acyltransferase YncA